MIEQHQTSTKRRSSRRRRSGLAAVELVFATPLLAPLLFGIWEIGRLIQIHQIVATAASDGTRLASMGVYSDSEVRQTVLNAITLAGVTAPNVTAAIENLTHPGVDASEATRLDVLRVTVRLPYSDVAWVNSNIFLSASTEIQRQVTGRSARGLDYPTDITVPPGH